MIAGPISALILTGTGVAIGSPLGVYGMTGFGVVFFVFGVPFGVTVSVARPYSASAWGIGVFVVDHTWSVLNTFIGAVYLMVRWFGGCRLDRANSYHAGVVVVNKPLGGFRQAFGNVEADPGPLGTYHRAHEDAHVFQHRLLGPFFLPLFLGGWVLLTLVPYWLRNHNHRAAPITGPWTYLENGVYPNMWNEKWADAVEDRFIRRTRTLPVR